MTVNEKSFALAQVSYLGFVAAMSFVLLSMPWMAFLGLSCVWVVAMLVYQCTPWRSMGGWWCLLAATVAVYRITEKGLAYLKELLEIYRSFCEGIDKILFGDENHE